MAESSRSNSESKQQDIMITLTIKTPKDKKDVQVSQEASVKEVKQSGCPSYPMVFISILKFEF